MPPLLKKLVLTSCVMKVSLELNIFLSSSYGIIPPENPLLENCEEQELGSDIERDLNEVCSSYVFHTFDILCSCQNVLIACVIAINLPPVRLVIIRMS